MADSTRKIRRMELDGRTYAWEAGWGRDEYILTIGSAEGAGQILRVTRIPLPSQDNRTLSAENELEGLVPHMIRAALKRGWRPDDPGLPDFFL
ncbi:hypothetical protein JW906_15235 [bacterium]|nr:hypothetical protein [bacterium]